MEIEGLDAYMEFKEAEQRIGAGVLINRYVDELLRQYSING